MMVGRMKTVFLSKNERIGLFWASPSGPFEKAGLKLWIGLEELRGHVRVLPLPRKAAGA